MPRKKKQPNLMQEITEFAKADVVARLFLITALRNHVEFVTNNIDLMKETDKVTFVAPNYYKYICENFETILNRERDGKS